MKNDNAMLALICDTETERLVVIINKYGLTEEVIEGIKSISDLNTYNNYEYNGIPYYNITISDHEYHNRFEPIAKRNIKQRKEEEKEDNKLTTKIMVYKQKIRAKITGKNTSLAVYRMKLAGITPESISNGIVYGRKELSSKNEATEFAMTLVEKHGWEWW